MDVQGIRAVTEAVRAEVRKAVVGQDDVIDLLLTSLLVGGHILLEGVPGTAKTLITRAFGAGLSLQFGRIQFTPDLMPGDVLGTNLFNFQTNSFLLTKGPIFTQLLLADEINRTPPKTQAALLQAMNERAVTIDGKDYPLGEEFMVVATQNPIEQQGTYPLPEAQLDRFLFKIVIHHPTRDEEREVVRRHGHRSAMPRLEDFGLRPVADAAVLAQIRAAVVGIQLSDALIDYIVDVIRATREHSSLEVGGSTRAANMLASSARAFAVLQGRDFVIPDDVKFLALPVLRHRLTLSPSAEIEGLTSDRILRDILDQTPGPAMIRPTGRAVAVFAAGIPAALLIVILAPDLWWIAFDYAALVLVAVATDALLAFSPRLLNVKVSLPDRLYIGEHGAIGVAIAATRYARTVRFEALAEQRGELEPAETVAVELPPGREARAALGLVPLRRGRVHIDRIWLRWRGQLGLVEHVRRIPVERTIDVLPNVRGVHGVALQFYAQEAIYGIKSQHEKGEGAEFEALREYSPGLDSRFIDWKHSARHRKLLCKEFRTERNHHVVMAFDTGYLMLETVEGITRLDHAINAGLLLAWVSLQSGDLVGTYGFDAAVRHYLAPIRGVAGFARIQRATGELDYHHQETNFTLGLAELNVRLRRRALVILFTDFVDTVTAELMIESMQRVANKHVVIFVTQRGSVLQRAIDAAPERFEDVAQAVIAHDFLRERSIVFERLERLGVHCLDVPSRGLSVALINRYLHVKQRGLI